MVSAMRFLTTLTTLTALMALAACATAPPPQSAPVASAAAAQPNRAAALLAQAGAGDAPTQSVIERTLGPPDIARRDGVGAALTYRLQTCALLLLFAADANNTMRLREAYAGPRRAGEAAPTLDQCAEEAGARRP
jgi:hypothetical protein